MNTQPSVTSKSQRQRISSAQLRKLREAQVQPNKPAAPVEKQASRITAKITTTPKKRVIEKLLPAAPKLPVASKTGSVSNGQSQLGTQLLSDIRGIFKTRKVAELRTQSILDALALKKPWASICSGKAINSRRLAALLKPFGIHSRDLRFTDGAFKGYKKEWFTSASNAKGKYS
jgi:hypothetical protein